MRRGDRGGKTVCCDRCCGAGAWERGRAFAGGVAMMVFEWFLTVGFAFRDDCVTVV